MNARIPQIPAVAGLERRQFLAAGTGLTLGLVLGGEAEAATATAVNAWLTIGADGSITLASGASDMGQGSFPGLAQILGEDLRVDPATVRVMPAAPSLAVPAPVGAAINTVGPSVTRSNFCRLRDAVARARGAGQFGHGRGRRFVEVSATPTGPRVTRVWLAIDCGWVVNPNSVEAQLIGGVVHGLNAALYGKQTFVNGAAQTRNFNASRMIRLSEMPQVVDLEYALAPTATQSGLRTMARSGSGRGGWTWHAHYDFSTLTIY